jgi:uncharacterized protein (TIGR02722 family)
MKNKILLPILAAAIPLIGAGCGTNAHYVQSGGSESVVSTGQINIQDYMQAADTMTGELLASGALDKVSSPPAVLAISRIVNNTGSQIDTDLLVKKIRVALLNSGKAVTTTTVGLGSTAEDPLAKQFQQQVRNPDFTLSGKIIQLAVRAGDTRQSTYSFQLSLTDAKTGYAVWEGDKDITKQGTRSSVGF